MHHNVLVKPFLLLLALICCFNLYSQENKEKFQLSLEDAINMAIENNTTLKTQSITLESARRTNDNLWNAFLPSVSLSGSASNSHLQENEALNKWSLSSSASASLSLSFAIPAQLKKTKLEYESALLSYNTAKNNLVQSVSTSYYSLIASEKNIEILQESYTLAEQQYNQTLKNYNNGLASELEMLNAKYSYLSIPTQIQQTISSYISSLRTFTQLIGYKEETEIDLITPISIAKLTLPQGKTLSDTYVEKRNDVIQSQLSLESAKLSKSIQTSSNLPSLSLRESLNLAENSTGNAAITGSFSASVSIPLSNLIPGSSTNLTIKSLDDSITKAAITLETTKTQAKDDIENKVSETNRLWQALDVSTLNQQIAERSYELSKEGYNSGLVSQTDLESSRQKMVNAQQSYLQAQISYVNSIYNLASSLQLSIEEIFTLFGGNQ